MSEPTGIKYDSGKPRVDLVSAVAITELAKVLAFGAGKYGDHNWRGGFKYSRVLGAILRHVFSYVGGEDKDPETGLSHIAHAMAGCMFLLEFDKTQKGVDDRYKND
jgi:hypothetical protein